MGDDLSSRTAMGGGNGQKSRMARERNMEKNKSSKGSQLEANKKAMNIQVPTLFTPSQSHSLFFFLFTIYFSRYSYNYNKPKDFGSANCLPNHICLYYSTLFVLTL
ncbi:hypothetical protein ACSQ67_013808 [Phaseolus vulgaris]